MNNVTIDITSGSDAQCRSNDGMNWLLSSHLNAKPTGTSSALGITQKLCNLWHPYEMKQRSWTALIRILIKVQN